MSYFNPPEQLELICPICRSPFVSDNDGDVDIGDKGYCSEGRKFTVSNDDFFPENIVHKLERMPRKEKRQAYINGYLFMLQTAE